MQMAKTSVRGVTACVHKFSKLETEPIMMPIHKGPGGAGGREGAERVAG